MLKIRNHNTQQEILDFYKRPKFKNLKGENLISQQLTDILDLNRSIGKTNGMYCKIAHEGKNSLLFNSKMRAIGKLAGVPDWLFIWPNNHLMIELKTRKGYLSPAQKFFHKEADKYDCNICIAKSAEEALGILYDYGFLKKD